MRKQRALTRYPLFFKERPTRRSNKYLIIDYLGICRVANDVCTRRIQHWRCWPAWGRIWRTRSTWRRTSIYWSPSAISCARSSASAVCAESESDCKSHGLLLLKMFSFCFIHCLFCFIIGRGAIELSLLGVLRTPT